MCKALLSEMQNQISGSSAWGYAYEEIPVKALDTEGWNP